MFPRQIHISTWWRLLPYVIRYKYHHLLYSYYQILDNGDLTVSTNISNITVCTTHFYQRVRLHFILLLQIFLFCFATTVWLWKFFFLYKIFDCFNEDQLHKWICYTSVNVCLLSDDILYWFPKDHVRELFEDFLYSSKIKKNSSFRNIFKDREDATNNKKRNSQILRKMSEYLDFNIVTKTKRVLLINWNYEIFFISNPQLFKNNFYRR